MGTERGSDGSAAARVATGHLPGGAACFASLLLMGCGGEVAVTDPGPLVSDSAGVRIVDYGPLEEWVDGPGMTELLRIENVDGADAELFSSLAGGFILPDRGIVLADAEAREVRQFSASGEFVRTLGRRGEGPGEYVLIGGMDRCRPEGFTVFDIGWTMSHYDQQGDFVEEQVTRLEGGGTPYHLACRETGVLAALDWDPAGSQPGFHTATGRLRLLARDGTELHDLEHRIGSERVGGPPGSAGPHPAGRSTRFAFSGEDLIVADGSFLGFERWGSDGNLEEIVRLSAEPPNLDSLMGVYMDGALARARSDDQRASWRRQIEDLEGPAQATFVSDLFASDTHVLVREPSVAESGRWFAFAVDGEPLGFLPFSAGTKLLDSRDGLLLVEQTDSLGVPAAVLLRVAWPTGDGDA